MNKQTEALKMAQEVPLIERLRSIPENARLIVDSVDGMSSSVHQVGYLCHKAAEALEQPAQWISVKDRLPEVKSGNAKEFIVVIYSGYTGRSFVTSRHFLNKMELYNEYSDNDFDEVSGWHERTYHFEYDDYYTLVDSCNADAVRYEVTHWMPLPDAPKEQA